MIDIKTTIHDKFSIEFKVGFVVGELKDNNFAINTWLFVPNSLDINPLTYGKEQFYRDVKSKVRMITPVFLLGDIAGGKAIPLKHLESALRKVAADPVHENVAGYEYHIKMFSAIMKSSLRNASGNIIGKHADEELAELTGYYVFDVSQAIDAYRDLKYIIDSPAISEELRSYYLFGDEFMSHMINHYSYGVLRRLDAALNRTGPEHAAVKKNVAKEYAKAGAATSDEGVSGTNEWRGKLKECRASVAALIERENAHKRAMGYVMISQDDLPGNRDIVFRHGILKKYVESDLYIALDKKQDGRTVRQIFYGFAAGIAMIFATVVAFAFQRSYGALSMPLFVAMVVSYIFKDRIKELTRFYFAHKLGRRYFDNKAVVNIKDHHVGWIKEGVDFITDDKVPHEVMALRDRSALREAENRVSDEKIILYRKLVYIDGQELAANNEYNVSGINDILRLHINRFTLKMDDPEVTLNLLGEDGSLCEVETEKIYYLNIVLQFQYMEYHDHGKHLEHMENGTHWERRERSEYRHFRVIMTRSGILGIE